MNSNIPFSQLLMLGVGQVALQVAEIASQYKVFGTTRNANKSQVLKSAGIIPFIVPDFFSRQSEKLIEHIAESDVLVSFPPDGQSDAMFSALCSKAKTIIYISSTSVYGNYSGIVNELTPVDWQSDRSKLRLQAEKFWLEKGAIILRAPGLYGPASGLHLRLRSNSYRLPPQNTNYISRIHLQDLARIILAAFAKPLPSSSIYLVGDIQPAPQIEVVQWLCQKMNLPLPDYCAPDSVPVTLTANRRIDASKILNELNIKLEFPTYKEGYSNCMQNC